MGLRSMQQALQQSRQQESNLTEQLTTALEASKADNSSLQQALQEKQQELSNLQTENSNLTNKLADAYKRIEKLANSDLELEKAQQLRQSANEDLESSKQLMREQESLKQQNEQKSKDLQSREQQLKKQQIQLEEQQKNLAATIGACKKQAETDAAAALADGWKELDNSKKAAEKEQEEARQHIEELKEEVQRELAAAQNATAEAAKKGYREVVSNYTLVMRCMIFFCGIFGLSEVIKHRYIFGVYGDGYIWLISHIGFIPAFVVGVAAVGIFAVTYFAPWGDYCDRQEYYLGLSMRLLLLICLYTMADAVADTTAAIVIYMSCIVVGILRWMVSHA